ERQSRWDGDELTADELRRMGSMQQTLTEMGRGERFVIDYLRTRGRERERWYIGLPLAAVGRLGAAAIARRGRRAECPHGPLGGSRPAWATTIRLRPDLDIGPGIGLA